MYLIFKKNVSVPLDDVNIALGQPTWQMDESHGGKSSRAVDGNENPDWRGGSCTHTRKNNQEWWVVDLGLVAEFKEVRVINRRDCCGKFICTLRLKMPALLKY